MSDPRLNSFPTVENLTLFLETVRQDFETDEAKLFEKDGQTIFPHYGRYTVCNRGMNYVFYVWDPRMPNIAPEEKVFNLENNFSLALKEAFDEFKKRRGVSTLDKDSPVI